MLSAFLLEGQPPWREEPMAEAKPFSISKRAVWDAWLRVKANQGAAGVDEESIESIEELGIVGMVSKDKKASLTKRIASSFKKKAAAS